jgi:hypothetical protein
MKIAELVARCERAGRPVPTWAVIDTHEPTTICNNYTVPCFVELEATGPIWRSIEDRIGLAAKLDGGW